MIPTAPQQQRRIERGGKKNRPENLMNKPELEGIRQTSHFRPPFLSQTRFALAQSPHKTRGYDLCLDRYCCCDIRARHKRCRTLVVESARNLRSFGSSLSSAPLFTSEGCSLAV